MEKPHNTGNLLFIIFWWIVQHVNIRWAHKLLYWGLRDGSFPSGHCSDTRLAIDLFGRHFPTPVGLGDGVDKRGNTLDALMQMGYSFGTFGPYTLEKELPSQEKFFFKADRAIISQCNGYRNPGLEKMLPWFVKRRYLPHFVGLDIAIPAESEESNIKRGRHFSYLDEFVLMAQRAAPYCDFLTLDFSHPNAELCVLVVDASTILPIVRAVKETVQRAAPIHPPKIFIKIPLDINTMEIPLVSQVLLGSGADGVVVAGPMSLAKNTRLRIQGAKEHQMAGQLIGKPTHQYVSELIRHLYPQLKDHMPIIATGGVFDGATAFAHIAAGASLIAIDEASLIFEGPGILHKIDKELGDILSKRHLNSITEAIGLDLREEEAKKQAQSAMPQPAPTTTPAAPMAPTAPTAPTQPTEQQNTPSDTPPQMI
ncbi:MAG: hypothetical protein II942_02275 [Alphaproteobacteria bacterium]|nr:hypothetical protein [Alphaproteobacteria bacterium]